MEIIEDIVEHIRNSLLTGIIGMFTSGVALFLEASFQEFILCVMASITLTIVRIVCDF